MSVVRTMAPSREIMNRTPQKRSRPLVPRYTDEKLELPESAQKKTRPAEENPKSGSAPAVASKSPAPRIENLGGDDLDVEDELIIHPEHEVLLKLFKSLDTVLNIIGLRTSRAVLSQVRQSVVLDTRKDLTDQRLRRILALASGMLSVRWNDSVGEVEFRQVLEDGKPRCPTAEELKARCAVFARRLQDALDAGAYPEEELPKSEAQPKPPIIDRSKQAEPRLDNTPGAAAAAAAASSPSSAGSSAIERFAQLVARVRAREAAGESQVNRAIKAARQRLEACENAIALQPLVSQLFVKHRTFSPAKLFTAASRKATSGVSEAQILSICTSATPGAQASKSVEMEYEKARSAIDHLAAHSKAWFVLSENPYVRGERSLRTIPSCSAVSALDSLMAERVQYRAYLEQLLEGGETAGLAANSVCPEADAASGSADFQPDGHSEDVPMTAEEPQAELPVAAAAPAAVAPKADVVVGAAEAAETAVATEAATAEAAKVGQKAEVATSLAVVAESPTDVAMTEATTLPPASTSGKAHYEAMKVTELKAVLKARGLKQAGAKAQLVERLLENDDAYV
eukprot:TRINITY_DN6740_c0_g1_i1.p1 TRINITY_DN6740_c0_g1~~TRINITY_DN6740_c0_g1_i1.p1  ORF type:complete len:570 (-),score=162.02 TRINITY_DN6740_c0_g1_i1:158-1867(-)